jgi:hypothetical protein
MDSFNTLSLNTENLFLSRSTLEHVVSTCLRDVYCDCEGTASDWYGLKNGLAASYCRHDGHEMRKTYILTICCWLVHLSNSLRFIYRNPPWLCQVNRTQRGKKRLLLFASSNSGVVRKNSAKHYKSQARWAISRPRLEPRT